MHGYDRRRHASWWAALVLLLLPALASTAQGQAVGTVAALEGTVEIGRGGTWMPAQVGAAVNMGDELRTGQPGRVRVVFQDQSVLAITDNSHVVVDQQVFNPNEGAVRSVVRLLRGEIGALVSHYYGQPGTVYHINTVTAVAGVRGTHFIVTYGLNGARTEVVGVTGRVEVHGLRDPVGHAVFVSAQEISTIEQGDFPTPARRLDDAVFRQYLEGLEFVGGGRLESLTIDNPLVMGAQVPEVDRSTALPAPPSTSAVPAISGIVPGQTIPDLPDASGIVGQPPGIVGFEGGRVSIRLF